MRPRAGMVSCEFDSDWPGLSDSAHAPAEVPLSRLGTLGCFTKMYSEHNGVSPLHDWLALAASRVLWCPRATSASQPGICVACY